MCYYPSFPWLLDVFFLFNVAEYLPFPSGRWRLLLGFIVILYTNPLYYHLDLASNFLAAGPESKLQLAKDFLCKVCKTKGKVLPSPWSTLHKSQQRET